MKGVWKQYRSLLCLYIRHTVPGLLLIIPVQQIMYRVFRYFELFKDIETEYIWFVALPFALILFVMTRRFGNNSSDPCILLRRLPVCEKSIAFVGAVVAFAAFQISFFTFCLNWYPERLVLFATTRTYKTALWWFCREDWLYWLLVSLLLSAAVGIYQLYRLRGYVSGAWMVLTVLVIWMTVESVIPYRLQLYLSLSVFVVLDILLIQGYRDRRKKDEEDF